MKTAAVVAVALLTVVTVFQIALALGAPLGMAAWGGKHPRRLPGRLRLASGVAAVLVYPMIILVVLASAGLISIPWVEGSRRPLMWVLAAVFSLGALANGASRSRPERIWSPVSLGIAACCAFIARWM